MVTCSQKYTHAINLSPPPQRNAITETKNKNAQNHLIPGEVSVKNPQVWTEHKKSNYDCLHHGCRDWSKYVKAYHTCFMHVRDNVLSGDQPIFFFCDSFMALWYSVTTNTERVRTVNIGIVVTVRLKMQPISR